LRIPLVAIVSEALALVAGQNTERVAAHEPTGEFASLGPLASFGDQQFGQISSSLTPRR
jgi:hypothetical protein